MNSEPRLSDESLNELGRRLFAALISYQLGLRSIDWALRKYTPARLPPSWGQLGLRLLACNLDQAVDRLKPAIERHLDGQRPGRGKGGKSNDQSS